MSRFSRLTLLLYKSPKIPVLLWYKLSKQVYRKNKLNNVNLNRDGVIMSGLEKVIFDRPRAPAYLSPPSQCLLVQPELELVDAKNPTSSSG